MNTSHMNKWRSVALGLVASLSLLQAQADQLRTTGASPAWRNECAGCHVAYPPKLLSANQWKTVMQGLDRHYGTDASLSSQEVAEITRFLVANGGKQNPSSQNGELPRVTKTAWFERKHREVPVAAWSHPQIKSRSNCAACHTRATEGSYSEREIAVPGMKGQSW